MMPAAADNDHRIGTRAGWGFIAVLLCATGTSGCSAALKPIFPEVDPPIVWPRPPGLPRIRYIGVLSVEADLGTPARRC